MGQREIASDEWWKTSSKRATKMRGRGNWIDQRYHFTNGLSWFFFPGHMVLPPWLWIEWSTSSLTLHTDSECVLYSGDGLRHARTSTCHHGIHGNNGTLFGEIQVIYISSMWQWWSFTRPFKRRPPQNVILLTYRILSVTHLINIMAVLFVLPFSSFFSLSPHKLIETNCKKNGQIHLGKANLRGSWKQKPWPNR